MSEVAKSRVSVAIRSMFRCMLCRKRPETEDNGDFIHKLNGKVSWLWDVFGIPPFELQVTKVYLGWIGHVARLPSQSVVYQVFFYRSFAWRDSQEWQWLRSNCRFFGPGKPARQADCCAVASFGPEWPRLAQDRRLWAETVGSAIAGRLPGTLNSPVLAARLGLRVPLVGPRLPPLPFGFLDFISNRHAEALMSSRMLSTTRVQFFAAFPHAIALLSGGAVPKPADDSFLRGARWLDYCLKFRWQCIPLAAEQPSFWVCCPPEATFFAKFCCDYAADMSLDSFVSWCSPVDISDGYGYVVTAACNDKGFMCACVQQMSAGNPGVFGVVGFAVQRLPHSGQLPLESICFAQRFWIQVCLKTGLAWSPAGPVFVNTTLGITRELFSVG